MNNFIVSYDLNGKTPTHAEMDKHIKAGCFQYARILETVWYVKRAGTAYDLFHYVGQILSPNDRLLVVEGGRSAMFKNLLVSDQALVNAWNGTPRAA